MKCPNCRQPIDDHDEEQSADCAYALGYGNEDKWGD